MLGHTSADAFNDLDGDGGLIVGEDVVIGALQRMMGQAARGGGGGGGSPFARRAGARPGNIYASPPLAAHSTWPHTAKLRSYMGFGFATWSPTDATDKPLPVQPQESFRGERLIIAQPTVVGGTSAGLVLMRRIDVGTMPQSPSVSQPAPAVMFQNDTVGSNLDLQIAYRATTIQVTLGITAAPGAGVTVTTAVGMFGVWIR
jgi:hypothetical protein